jgi:hypothetical protein
MSSVAANGLRMNPSLVEREGTVALSEREVVYERLVPGAENSRTIPITLCENTLDSVVTTVFFILSSDIHGNISACA